MKRFSISALTIACLSFCGCSDSTDADASPLTVEAISTTAAPSSDLPLLIFDGDKCTYAGPDQVPGGGLIEVTLENSSDIDIDASLFGVRNEGSLTAAFDRLPPGTGSDILLAPPPGSRQEAWLQASAGGSNTESLLLDAGLYLLDCGRIPYGDSAPDYVWRGGSFEVFGDQ